ncbi:FeoA family protein [Anaerofustis sp. NSJ-163]|uniref:FeoA family protein n=1 Tax=Anaerofustis sp. NSJ-163 TaxID=2944391 RepID=UPI00209C1CBF|nr:FeoA family protein [Anaerofustis sp. NSJ-163]MCO8194315.1 ferrous iron transport protein A [Anaerofustis sp. NSJ-163]
MIKLTNVKIGQTKKVKKICANKDDKRRFLDLGLINGTKIKPVFVSPLNDPVAYEIRGSIIALRKEDSDKIYVY